MKTIKKLNNKKLDLKKNLKLYLVAYDKDGNKIGKTLAAHIAGKNNKKYTNPKEYFGYLKIIKNSGTLLDALAEIYIVISGLYSDLSITVFFAPPFLLPSWAMSSS